MKQLICREYLYVLIFLLLPAAAPAQTGEADDKPYELGLTYTGEVWGNLAGGVNTGAVYMDNIDLTVEVDLAATPLGLEGARLFAYGMGNQGGSISALAGDMQAISNIETPNSWRIYEFWVEQKFEPYNSSLKMGLYDINSEFNVLESSLFYINSSHGVDAALATSGVMGPSIFPYLSMGVRLEAEPVEGWTVRAALLDGIPSNPANPRGTKIFWRQRDGLLYLAEAAWSPAGERTFKLAAGGWAYSKQRPGWISDGTEHRHMGLYVLGEYQLVMEEGNPGQGLTLFGRASMANGDINRLGGYIGGGVTYRGLLEGRPGDLAGLAIGSAVNSSDHRRVSPAVGERVETNVELSYLTVLSSAVSVQGDLQYVMNPNMNPALDNAFAAGMRLILTF